MEEEKRPRNFDKIRKFVMDYYRQVEGKKAPAYAKVKSLNIRKTFNRYNQLRAQDYRRVSGRIRYVKPLPPELRQKRYLAHAIKVKRANARVFLEHIRQLDLKDRDAAAEKRRVFEDMRSKGVVIVSQ